MNITSPLQVYENNLLSKTNIFISTLLLVESSLFLILVKYFTVI